MSDVLLEARGIIKSYQKSKLIIPVLKGIDFKLHKGETVAIVGSSGAGKSTLLQILGTLDTPTSGKVFFEGKEVFSMKESSRAEFRNRNLGFIFQFHYLLPEFTALENVMMPGLIAGRKNTGLKKEAQELLDMVGLSQRMNHKPSELSGGESQRVAVARALCMRPSLVLGDEITGNLDQENGSRLLSLLLEVNKKFKTSIVLVTHDAKVAAQMSKVVEMVDGNLSI